jgi:hypothetical protein
MGDDTTSGDKSSENKVPSEDLPPELAEALEEELNNLIDLRPMYKVYRRLIGVDPTPPKFHYGRSYIRLSRALWVARYDAAAMRSALVALESPPQHLSSSESRILWAIFAENQKAVPVTIANLEFALQLSNWAIRRTLKRLGDARIIVNVGTDRMQRFAINPLIEFWDPTRIVTGRNKIAEDIQERLKK